MNEQEDPRLKRMYIRIVGIFANVDIAVRVHESLKKMIDAVQKVAKPGYVWPFFEEEMVQLLSSGRLEFCESLCVSDLGDFCHEMYMERKDRAIEILLSDDDFGAIIKILVKAGGNVTVSEFV